MSPKESIKAMAAAALAASGLHRAWHRRVHQHQVAILMYHSVVRTPLPVPDWCFLDARSFRGQVVYIKDHFSVLPFSQVVDALKNDAVDRPTAVLTFDDGYQNNYDVAFPVLSELAVPATIFLTTSLIDSGDTVWFCRLNDALTRTKKKSFEWRKLSFDISDAVKKAQASTTLQALLKQYPPYALNSILLEIIEKLDVEAVHAIRPGSPYQMLRESAIKAMLKSGLIDIGAHTHTHAILGQLSLEEQRREIEQSLDIVKELTGQPCKFFAYPNGRAQDFNQVSMNLLQSAGVKAAVSTVAGPNDTTTPRLGLRRYSVGSNTGMAAFQLMVHHFVY
jgi:peptidoglycan/xylan/chitin deacetylase (PgdA/CDA1 family)